jgi:recombination protein RecA
MTAALAEHLVPFLGFRAITLRDTSPTGVPGLDLARGAITDVYGLPSSGRTSLLLSILAAAIQRQEVCALVDTSDSFDPVRAAAAGVDLDRLLWVRCGGDAGRAMKAVDLLIQGGGFGVVALDLADVPAWITCRIPLASWFRLRKAVENTPTSLVALGREAVVRSPAAAAIEMKREGARWSGAPGCSDLLRGLRLGANVRKPVRQDRARFEASAVAG